MIATRIAFRCQLQSRKDLLAPDCCQGKRGDLGLDDQNTAEVTEAAGIKERINSPSKLRTY